MHCRMDSFVFYYLISKMNMKIIAVFDFDGTITSKDTLLEFIKFSVGRKNFLIGFALHLPFLIAYKLKLYPNWKIKQRILSYFFKNKNYNEFVKLGNQFKYQIDKFINSNIMQEIKKHQEQGHDVYIVSASIYEWIQPWAKQNGINHILSTTLEIDKHNRITGKLLSSNCYGIEKVNRFLAEEPNRHTYTLYAYGDSNGDKELFKIADKSFWCKHNFIKEI